MRSELLDRHREANGTAWSPAVRALLDRHSLEPGSIPRRAPRLTRRDVEAFLTARKPAAASQPERATTAAGVQAATMPPAPDNVPQNAVAGQQPKRNTLQVCSTRLDLTGIEAAALPAALVAALVEIAGSDEALSAALAPPRRLLLEDLQADADPARCVISGAGELNAMAIRSRLAAAAQAGTADGTEADVHVIISAAAGVLPAPAQDSGARVILTVTPGAPSVEAVPGVAGSTQIAIRSMADAALAIRSASVSSAVGCTSALRAVFAGRNTATLSQ